MRPTLCGCLKHSLNTGLTSCHDGGSQDHPVSIQSLLHKHYQVNKKHPLIYLDFMYHGVANFHQHNFDRCVSKAAELQLKELKGGTEKQSCLKKKTQFQTNKKTDNS